MSLILTTPDQEKPVGPAGTWTLCRSCGEAVPWALRDEPCRAGGRR